MSTKQNGPDQCSRTEQTLTQNTQDRHIGASKIMDQFSPEISIFTSDKPQRLTKRWSIKDGEPIKEGAGAMTRGRVERRSVNNPRELVSVLKTLQPNQALGFGLPSSNAHIVVTTAELDKHPEAIARTKEVFNWPSGAGWMMLDHDPKPGSEPRSREDLLEAIYKAWPGLQQAPYVWCVSSSSCIVNTDTGKAVTNVSGQRVYILVNDAQDIERAGKALIDRLWLAGFGYFQISKAGHLLERTLVDASVWQTNRLDFAAPPVCIAPLESRRPDPETFNPDAGPVDLQSTLPDLTAAERTELEQIKQDLRSDDGLLQDQAQVQMEWVQERLSSLPDSTNDEDRLQREQLLIDAVRRKRLFGDFVLHHSTGRTVTVGEILDDPDRWHGERFADPLEPEYSNNDKRIAWVNLRSGGPAYIYSHAHGGQRFRLLRPSQTLQLSAGDMPGIVSRVLEVLRLGGEVYERAGMLVRMADGEMVPVDTSWLRTHLEMIFNFLRFDSRAGKWRPADCPVDLAHRILSARGTWQLPKVSVLVDHPVLRSDGTLLSRAGHDPQTDILLIDDQPSRAPLRALDADKLREAVRRIWEPFAAFPFADAVSRGVFLSALFTTVCRPSLPTAPAFLIRAPSPGTGKSLMSECLMILVGAKPTAMPLPDNTEEIEKRLYAKLLTGCAGLVLDNLVNKVDSAALCAFLTSPEPEGRILGKSEARSISNRALWVLNGNNVYISGDAFRRILPVNLDARDENPERRSFNFNPRTVITKNLDQYRADLLSVLLTYQEWGEKHGTGSLGSFGDWEALVRQCVCWLAHEEIFPAAIADPLEVLTLNKLEDPGHSLHVEILEAWFELWGNSSVRMRDIVRTINRESGREFGYYGSDNPEREARDRFIEAVSEIAPARGGFNGRYFGAWCKRVKGVVAGGLRLEPGALGVKDPGWRVLRIS